MIYCHFQIEEKKRTTFSLIFWSSLMKLHRCLKGDLLNTEVSENFSIKNVRRLIWCLLHMHNTSQKRSPPDSLKNWWNTPFLCFIAGRESVSHRNTIRHSWVTGDLHCSTIYSELWLRETLEPKKFKTWPSPGINWQVLLKSVPISRLWFIFLTQNV